MPRRFTLTAWLCLGLALAGCSGRTQAPAPAAAPPVKAEPAPAAKPAEPPAPEPPPKLVTLDGEPVDWQAAWSFDRPELPVHAGVCIPGTAPEGTHLQVNLTAADWRVHPLSRGEHANGEFWAPAGVLTVCNAGKSALEHPFLHLAVGDRDNINVSTTVSLPRLQPGEGAGPIRVFAATGVPAKVGALWVEDGRRWPDWTIQLREEKAVVAERRVARVLGGEGSPAQEAPGGAAALPDLPPLPLLQKLAWSRGTFSPDGKQQVEIYLYTPDASYHIQETPWCGAAPGYAGIGGKQWAFYTSTDGGPPVRAKEIGQLGFEGGRGMQLESVPALGMTFLLFGSYLSCANPSVYSMYAYDHATHEIVQPRMRYENGKVDIASVGSYSFSLDGQLVSKGYSIADGKPYHTTTYHWDPRQRMWLFVSHVQSKTP